MTHARNHASTAFRTVATRRGAMAAVLLSAALVSGCRQDMHDQPRYRPLAGSDFFADGRSARPLIPGTIPRGHLRADTRYYQGREGRELIAELPVKLTRELVLRGQERYNIFCSPCHGRTGNGEGMVVERGFRQPVQLQTAFVGDVSAIDEIEQMIL